MCFIIMFVTKGNVCAFYWQPGPHEKKCSLLVYISSSENEMIRIYIILRIFLLLCLFLSIRSSHVFHPFTGILFEHFNKNVFDESANYENFQYWQTVFLKILSLLLTYTQISNLAAFYKKSWSSLRVKDNR